MVIALPQQKLRPVAACGHGPLKPFHGRLVALLHANALVVAIAQIAQGPGVPRLRRLAVERHRFIQVPVHPPAQLVAQAKGTGAGDLAPVTSGLKQSHRPHQVLLHAKAPVIALPQQVQRPGITALGRPGKPVGGLFVVLVHADAHVIAKAQVAGGGGIARVRPHLIELHRVGQIPFHAHPRLIAQAKGAGSGDKALDIGTAIAFRRLPAVLGRPPAHLAADAIEIQPPGAVLLRRLAIELGGLFPVGRDPDALVIALP